MNNEIKEKRYLSTGEILIVYDYDFPNHNHPCGLSIYKGVIVQWDEDQDRRVLAFIDNMNEYTRKDLIIVQESKGTLALRWIGVIPPEYQEGKTTYVCDEDMYIYSSEKLTG